MKNGIAAVAATLSCVLTTLTVTDAPARAATVTESATTLPRARVAFADLDLSSNAGVEALESRIRLAADKICRTTAVESLPYKTARSRCYRTAKADGFRQADRIIAMRGDHATRRSQLAMRTR